MTENNKVFVLGDIGGQAQVFDKVLEELNIDSEYRIPEGVQIIQVGDIVRNRGGNVKDSLYCLNLAGSLSGANPGKYFQLLGNYEFAYLEDGAYPHYWILENKIGEVINEWWENREDMFLLSASISTPKENMLVTHAGLTRGYWEKSGNVNDATEVSSILNSLKNKPVVSWSSPGELVTGKDSEAADFVWASAKSELYPGWVLNDHPVPFSQIHGHSVLFNWVERTPRNGVSKTIAEKTRVSYKERLSSTLLGSDSFGENKYAHSVDWVLGNAPTGETFGLFSLEGTVVK